MYNYVTMCVYIAIHITMYSYIYIYILSSIPIKALLSLRGAFFGYVSTNFRTVSTDEPPFSEATENEPKKAPPKDNRS